MNVVKSAIRKTSTYAAKTHANTNIVVGTTRFQEKPIVAIAQCSAMRHDRKAGCIEGLITLSILDKTSATPITTKRWVSVFIMNEQTAAERRELMLSQALYGFLREYRPYLSSALIAA